MWGSLGITITQVTKGDTVRGGSGIRGLDPGYFALVMATGIVSVALHLEGFGVLSDVLLGITVVCAVALLILTGVRLIRHRDALVDDVRAPQRAFGFFTLVAGANVVGVRFALDGHVALPAVLAVAAGLLWGFLGYLIPWTAVLGRHERPIIATANGTWFVWVVAAQSVSVSAATLQPAIPGCQSFCAIVAVGNWAVGLILYAAAGLFVGARMLQYRLDAADLTPPYWIAMGAASISVLAGARIVEMADAPILAAVRGMAAGTSVVLWAFATWLIPPLLLAGWWRHGVHRVPLRYGPELWSIIFPLGMYSVASSYLGIADRLPVVGVIGRVELWLAVTAWTAAFIAMLVHFARRVRDRLRRTP